MNELLCLHKALHSLSFDLPVVEEATLDPLCNHLDVISKAAVAPDCTGLAVKNVPTNLPNMHKSCIGSVFAPINNGETADCGPEVGCIPCEDMLESFYERLVMAGGPRQSTGKSPVEAHSWLHSWHGQRNHRGFGAKGRFRRRRHV